VLSNCILSHRELTQEDYESGFVVLSVSSAAMLGGNRGNVTKTGDTAIVPIDDRSAATDVSFTVAPTTFHDAGEAAGVAAAQAGWFCCLHSPFLTTHSIDLHPLLYHLLKCWGDSYKWILSPLNGTLRIWPGDLVALHPTDSARSLHECVLLHR
jgi:hypothetical protein